MPARLLIVDDPALCTSMARALVQLGCTVEAVSSIEHAHRMLRSGGYACVLVEVTVDAAPDDALAFFREVRASAPAALRVAMSVDQPPSVFAALADGLIHEHLQKPFGWPALERIAQRTLPRE